ncbi:hypothetical protein OLZ90_003837 [Salmonella enterica]|nr:hypothetical protein [Salmonella enterica]
MEMNDEAPLYQKVAIWGVTQKQGITVSSVAKHFGLSSRQASHVVRSVINDSSGAIYCHTVNAMHEGKFRRVIVILYVDKNAFIKRNKENRSKKEIIQNEVMMLRQWFTHRKIGEHFPER